ncbi:ribose-5-phosphate isomerase A [Candidatus Methanoplasma termitum]|uniref:Ribose-5-phosphate isomerase A n=1 Tax=Candidatus Methanoplasma termitum TaxID=1577791 RepID=A0A0A7LHF3_9ARCH|nr:ribose-5-phosphate isomerase RpiA [Candidatus Methanoplasma termitum]AIZ56946.1 ribose-5-phosphate isomerase A [Candidatus Methanoplasma termitum]MCL2333259.1 ribose-5-phosphate isomerase RpiA [Candidatus Methanoplasma sp.]
MKQIISEKTPNLKKIVAEKAVDDFVKDGMTVGLGTGSTAEYAIKRVGELVKNGFKLKCVATSQRTADLAESLGVRIYDVDEVDHIDVTIDGADEVDPQKQLIKGLGGALLREKIVAAASLAEVIIVDESKIVEKLGMKTPLPVEVIPYGHKKTAYALERQGCKATLRMKDGKPFITDAGNYIYDCKFEAIESPFFLESRIDVIPGVVENGLFLNTADVVLISHPDGTVTKRE